MPFEASHTDVEASFLARALAPASRVLEAGCGRKTRLGAYRDRISELVGVDLDEAAGAENAALDRFVAADLCERLPFEDESFDLVYANFVVEHLGEPERALAEWRRVLRPDGSLILLTSNRANPFLAAAGLLPRGLAIAVKRGGAGVAERDVFPTRYRANTPRRLAAVAEGAGFEPVDVRYVATLHRYAERVPLLARLLRELERLLPPRLRSTIVGWYRALPVLVVLAAGCGGGGAETTTTEPTTPAQFEVTGLEAPWEIAFVDETTALVTERPGRVRVVEDGRLRERPVATIPVQAVGEGGLLGLAVREGFAYVYYTAAEGNRVSRFRLGEDLSFGDEQVLLDGIPASSVHDGGRIAFGPDGQLYVATGDAGDSSLATDRSSLSGKILRLTPEGGEPEVFSWGHRNPQGLAWSDDGTMYAAEHGPSGEFGLCCHDEVNVIVEGGYYGWPFRAGAGDTGAGEPPEQPRDPLAESGGDTWAPAGAAWFDGALHVATLRGERLLRITPEGEVSTALEGRGRLRALVVGPEGCLYVGTSNRDGRGDAREGDDRIIRICDG